MHQAVLHGSSRQTPASCLPWLNHQCRSQHGKGLLPKVPHSSAYPFYGICLDCDCRIPLYRNVRHARTSVRVSSEWWCRWVDAGCFLCRICENRELRRQNSSAVPEYCPVERIYLLLLRCDWAYVRQSKGFGQVAPFFSVTNWYPPIKLRKIYHLAKFLSHLFHWKIRD